MPIKLNAVIRTLNVGINSVADFLRGKGFDLDENVNINKRISNDALKLLVKEFGKDVPPEAIDSLYVEAKIKSAGPANEQPATQPAAKPVKTPEAQPSRPMIETEIPENMKPRIVGFIDLNGNKESRTGNTDQPEGEASDNRTKKSASPNNVQAVNTNKATNEFPSEKQKENEKSVKADGEQPKENVDANRPTMKQPEEKPVRQTKEEQAPTQPAAQSSQPKETVEKPAVPSSPEKKEEKIAPQQPVAKKEEPKQHAASENKNENQVPAAEKPVQLKPTSKIEQPKTGEKNMAAGPSEKNDNNKKEMDNMQQKENTPDAKPNDANDSDKIVTEAEPVKEDEVFRLHTPRIETNIKVTGKIDLDALNQSTHPKKKTKEEKRKERVDKQNAERQSRNQQRSFTPKEGAANRPGTSPQRPAGPTPAKPGENTEHKRRNRIKKDRVDINSISNSNNAGANNNNKSGNGNPVNSNNNNFQRQRNDDRRSRYKKPIKAEVSEEDVQKQIKETLARLTTKSNKGAKYRREKRDAVVKREHDFQEQEMKQSKILKLTEFVTANDLANMMNVPVTKVISTCMSIGIMVSINQRLDADTINLVAEEFGFKTEYVSADVVEAIKADETEEDNEEDWTTRPPIVTVMGHVDHGKTSLLDNIRKANVIAGEAGGITQHIGAYNVKLPSGRHITFLDTPGHEAFTAMRARGAKVTDIAIIIIAADDSVMPQTVEAINHAAAAGVPIVFAINKIDKPHANSDKIKEELAAMNYLVEDWGGKYQCQEISAKKGIGVNDLLEKVLLEADLLDLKANPKLKATGTIIESSLDKGRGYVATILVENGTLRVGDVMIAGTHFGRVKAMFNERNQKMDQVAPSEPALILGLSGAPQAGDTFNVLDTEQEAREIAGRRQQLQRELGLRTHKLLTLDEISRRKLVGNFQELNLIVKGDVDGSVEALSDSLIRLSTNEIQVNVIHKAIGQISESDVELAAASNAIIIGFQVRPSAIARKNAEREGVEIRLYSIIYDAINEVKSAMEGMLSPEIKEEITATVEVQQVFKINKVGTVAGGIVTEGKIKRTNKVRVIRDGIVTFTGALGSLKRFKDDVKEVVTGQDCGLNIDNYNDIQVGDIIESFEEKEIKKTL